MIITVRLEFDVEYDCDTFGEAKSLIEEEVSPYILLEEAINTPNVLVIATLTEID